MEISTLERTRKRLFALLCISFFLLIIAGFIIINILENDTLEILINAIAGVILLAGLIGIRKFDRGLLVYRFIITMMSAAYLYSVSIGSGKGTVIYWLFPFPLVFLFFLGKSEGSIFFAVFFVALSILMINPLSFDIYAYDIAVTLRFLASYLLVALIAYGLEVSREKYANLLIEERAKLLKEKENLERALRKVKTLSGLIPICSNCKKIRDDEGYWQHVDTYVRDHTSANFSHSICPDCAKKLYPELKHTEK